jgi:GT2 family glycosyltransferase
MGQMRDKNTNNTPNSKQVSVIICTYNRKVMLKKCLDAIFLQDFPDYAYEVVVVIDGSTDGTELILQELSPPCQFKFIRQENTGLATARNNGSKEAEGEILLFLDDDIIAIPELITEHIKYHQAGHPLVVGNIPVYPVKYSDYMIEGTKAWAQDQFQKMEQENYEITFQDIYFANASIKRELFYELGGFDEQFRYYGVEDRDFAYRLLKAGIKPMYNPRAIGYQIYLKDFNTYCNNYYWVGRGEVKLVKKYPELWPFLRLSGYHYASWWKKITRHASLWYPKPVALVMTILKSMMEGARRIHLKGAFLTRLQAFIRDYYYWLGVKEEIGGPKEILAFLERGSWLANESLS